MRESILKLALCTLLCVGIAIPQAVSADMRGPALDASIERPTSAMVAYLDVAAGDNHTCGLTAGGGVKCWGYNLSGQLGNGDWRTSLIPVEVSGLSSGISAVEAGSAHNCALTSGGGVKCWGDNYYGQVGNVTQYTKATTPLDVIGLASGIKAIAAGGYHSCALTSGGGVKCWGANGDGQLGNGTTEDSMTPVGVSGLASGVVAIAAGSEHSCALTAGGIVKCWGIGYDSVPVEVSGASGASAIVSGHYHNCLLTGSGAVECWHNGSSPEAVLGLESGVKAIATGFLHTCAVTGSGVQCWGDNEFGQLGDGTTVESLAPVAVLGLGGGVTRVTTGTYHTCAVSANGGVKCWGKNEYGQLGNGKLTYSQELVPVSGLKGGINALEAGYANTCALTAGGGVVCWGWNKSGQLGNGTMSNTSTPVQVSGLASGLSAIAAGGLHSCAVTAGGGAKCWGYNFQGQLGSGTNASSSTPVDVSGLGSVVIDIAVGDYHTCALTAGGGVKCWGDNNYGQQGNGTWEKRPMGDVVGLTSGVSAIAIGLYHSCALTSGGGVKCWGWNVSGQLGDGTTTNRNAPVDVVGLSSGVVAIATGGYHTCALTAVGGAKCWGENWAGQLGDGTNDSSLTPVEVSGLSSGVVALALGDYSHTCALTASGGVKCWGALYGISLSGNTPVDVSGLESGVSAIAAGWGHTCAALASGGVCCWGDNEYGQLGNGEAGYYSTPVYVVGSAMPSLYLPLVVR